MSTVGQSVSIDGGDSAAASAERSAGVACTVEKPGIDGNQSELVDADEHPAKARASSDAAPHAPMRRSTEFAGPIEAADLLNRRPLTRTYSRRTVAAPRPVRPL